MTTPSFTYYHFVMIVKSKRWKKLTYSILTALGIGMLTSCYGMPVTSNFICVRGRVTRRDEQPIKGIQVSLDYNGITCDAETDEDGLYYLEILFDDYIDRNVTIHFKDIDGIENGSYSGKTQEITLDEFGDCEVNVTLDEIQS